VFHGVKAATLDLAGVSLCTYNKTASSNQHTVIHRIYLAVKLTVVFIGFIIAPAERVLTLVSLFAIIS